jgi:hypothetical protein
MVWIANALVILAREASTPAVRGLAANSGGAIRLLEHHHQFCADFCDPSGRQRRAALNNFRTI